VLKAARSYDAILIYREASLIGPAIYERLLVRTGRPMILDFDDAIWSPAQAHLNGLFSRLHSYGKTSTICRIASAVTVGNDYLAGYARQRNDRVFVIPSTIELADYPEIAEPPQDGAFVVGWTGSASTLPHFETARPALEDLARQIPLKVRVICNRPPDRPITGAETEFVAWTAEDEARQVGNCHAGIMPLPDDEVSRGKCGMKALQFMATGRPVVASPVGVNSKIIRAGENGLLASSTEEFVSALMQLAADPKLRHRMGRQARKTIEQEYSAEAASRAFARVVRSVVR
ncbi:MAG: glycosyltransferase, partial [Sphingomonas sp.]|nr:glycosyltransferase [Sphingomonas sp.]